MLFLDLETYSPVDIKHGLYKYAEDAKLLLLSYAFDEEPAAVVDFANGEAIPPRLLAALKNEKAWLCAHNAQFDRTILEKYIPEVAPPKRWVDTRALAYSAGLPGSLKELCEVLKVPADKAKEKRGADLIKMFCVPQRDGGRPYSKKERPFDWLDFVNYARLDVEALREIYKRIPRFNATRQLLNEWNLDQEINKRGMFIDLALARAAVEASNRVEARSNAKVHSLTNGFVKTTGQTAKILEYAAKCGYPLSDLQKETLEREIPSAPPVLREVLEARLANSKSSVKKYRVLLDSTNTDGRLRGCLQFYGAIRTGRWSGKLFQPQNLIRGSLPANEIEKAIDALKKGETYFEDENELAANCLRAAIMAPPGKKFVVADLSNIEGRVLAWLAGEKWKINAFREGTVDLYKAAYARTFGIPVESVDKKQRQIGKVLELSMGYQGGVGAFLIFARGYGVDLDSLAANVTNKETLIEAEQAYSFYADKKQLPKKTFIALEAIKRAWRKAHPAIVSFWENCQNGALKAITTGDSVKVGKIAFERKDKTLCIRLPSGRFMPYPNARKDDKGFTYFGQLTHKWGELRTYAGKIAENITQAVARDILVQGMFNAERAGYPIILTVHDELITECPDSPEYNPEQLSALMATPPEWAKDIPLAAAGWEGKRYRKD